MIIFFFFSVKIHVFRVKNFDILKTKFLKNKQKTLNFNILKKCKLLKLRQLNQVFTS